MRTKHNILIHELIGLKVKIVKSKSAAYYNLSGTVIDETKNMLAIATARGIKRVPKSSCMFRFDVDDGSVDVDGSLIAYRPEDRPKRLLRYIRRYGKNKPSPKKKHKNIKRKKNLICCTINRVLSEVCYDVCYDSVVRCFDAKC